MAKPTGSIAKIVTYSKNVFIPLTNACRNRCSYCGFRSSRPQIMSRAEVEAVLDEGRKNGCKEALFTLGEKPEENKEIKAKLLAGGYSSITEYLSDLCRAAIARGLLPHSNLGVVEREELKVLKEVNASMGLMLESSSARLCDRGMPHEKSPGKLPELRIAMIEDAGKLKIPFTTGLLIGIGETDKEVVESLEVIRGVDKRYGNIQEVILQNFKPKKGTPMQSAREPPLSRMVRALKAARSVLPDASIQIPPNLNPSTWQRFLLMGANDLGGVSPTTKDYINPEADWPKIEEMEAAVRKTGMLLRERLCIYPKFIKKGWYSREIAGLIHRYADEDGLVRGRK